MSDTEVPIAIQLCLVYLSFKKYELFRSQQSEKSKLGRDLVLSGAKIPKTRLSAKRKKAAAARRYESLIRGRKEVEEELYFNTCYPQLETKTHKNALEVLDFYGQPLNHQTKKWNDYTTITGTFEGQPARIVLPRQDLERTRDLPSDPTIYTGVQDFYPNDVTIISSGFDIDSFLALADSVVCRDEEAGLTAIHNIMNRNDSIKDVIKFRTRRTNRRKRTRRKRWYNRLMDSNLYWSVEGDDLSKDTVKT